MGGAQGRYHLGIGGDLGGQTEPLRHHQVGVVVNVAVEHRCDQRDGSPIGPERVDRMGVGLGDDAHAGPTSVAEDRALDIRGGQSPGQQTIIG